MHNNTRTGSFSSPSLLGREARTLRFAGETPQPKTPDADKIASLNTEESMEKAKYAYDKVQDRIKTYRDHIQELNELAAGREKTDTNFASEIVNKLKFQGEYQDTFKDETLTAMSKARQEGDEQEYQRIKSRAERIRMFFYKVDKLEELYGSIEKIVARVEKSIGDRTGTAVKPNLQEKFLAMRTKTLDAQMKQGADAPDKKKLQSIQIDTYNQPFTNMDERRSRTYHLLRVPQDVDFKVLGIDLEEGEVGRMERVQVPMETYNGTRYVWSERPVKDRGDYEIVQLSGGAKYYKFSPAVMKKLEGKDAELYRDGKKIGTATLKINDLNNVVFEFKEEGPEKPRIGVTPDLTFETGVKNDGEFTISVAKQAKGEKGKPIPEDETLKKILVDYGGDGVYLDAGRKIDILVEGGRITLERSADGKTVKATSETPITSGKSLRFKTDSDDPGIERKINVVTPKIDATPAKLALSAGDKGAFDVTTPVEGSTTKSNAMKDETVATFDGKELKKENDTQTDANGVQVTRLANGKYEVTGDADATAKITFTFRGQEVTRDIEVQEKPEIEVTPKQQTLDLEQTQPYTEFQLGMKKTTKNYGEFAKAEGQTTMTFGGKTVQLKEDAMITDDATGVTVHYRNGLVTVSGGNAAFDYKNILFTFTKGSHVSKTECKVNAIEQTPEIDVTPQKLNLDLEGPGSGEFKLGLMKPTRKVPALVDAAKQTTMEFAGQKVTLDGPDAIGKIVDPATGITLAYDTDGFVTAKGTKIQPEVPVKFVFRGKTIERKIEVTGVTPEIEVTPRKVTLDLENNGDGNFTFGLKKASKRFDTLDKAGENTGMEFAGQNVTLVKGATIEDKKSGTTITYLGNGKIGVVGTEPHGPLEVTFRFQGQILKHAVEAKEGMPVIKATPPEHKVVEGFKYAGQESFGFLIEGDKETKRHPKAQLPDETEVTVDGKKLTVGGEDVTDSKSGVTFRRITSAEVIVVSTSKANGTDAVVTYKHPKGNTVTTKVKVTKRPFDSAKLTHTPNEQPAAFASLVVPSKTKLDTREKPPIQIDQEEIIKKMGAAPDPEKQGAYLLTVDGKTVRIEREKGKWVFREQLKPSGSTPAAYAKNSTPIDGDVGRGNGLGMFLEPEERDVNRNVNYAFSFVESAFLLTTTNPTEVKKGLNLLKQRITEGEKALRETDAKERLEGGRQIWTLTEGGRTYEFAMIVGKWQYREVFKDKTPEEKSWKDCSFPNDRGPDTAKAKKLHGKLHDLNRNMYS